MTYLINIIMRIFIIFMIIFSLFIFKILASEDCKGYSYSTKGGGGCVLKKSKCEEVRISGSPLLTKAYKKQCLKYFVDKEVTSDETIKKVDEKSIKKGVTSIETVKTVDGRSITINENGTCSISKNENIISYEIISYEKSKYGSDCDITFKIKNNTTFGTIHKARLSVHAIDDKGKKIDSGSQYYPFSNKKPLKIGQETNGKFNVDTKCKYIKKIIVTDLFPLYCNIRKLPEDVNCYELVKIESLTDIPIEKL